MTLRGLQVRAIPAPRPFALLEKQNKLSSRPDYIVMEDPQGSRTLRQHIQRKLSPAERRYVFESVAGLLRSMRDREVYHTELNADAILIRKDANGVKAMLADPVGARLESPWDRRRTIRSLKRLHADLPPGVTLREKVRFLRAFAPRWNDDARAEVARKIAGGSPKPADTVTALDGI
jgi:hypothetical protein